MIDSPQKIQLLYFPGTFGNCLRWCFEKFHHDSKITEDSPWDHEGTVHQDHWQYQNIFQLTHHVGQKEFKSMKAFQPDKDKPTIVISFEQKHMLFAERTWFFRVIRADKEKFFNDRDDRKWILERFGKNFENSYAVIKELYKIQFYSAKGKWWNEMTLHLNNTEHFHFPVYAFTDKKMFIEYLNESADRFNLNLDIDENIVKSITDRIASVEQVKTINRAETVLNAINKGINMDCRGLDIIEQAWIETKLESENLLFPYGTQWFDNTQKIKEYIETCPYYRRHKYNLPWMKKNRIIVGDDTTNVLGTRVRGKSKEDHVE